MIQKVKIIISLFICTLLCACSSDKYKETIANYVQTDHKGTWTDIKFKVIKLAVRDVTVQDSINLLQERFAAEHNMKVAQIQKSIDYWKRKIADNPKDIVEKALNESRKKSLEKYEKEMSEVKQWIPAYLSYYKEVADKSSVLGKVVSCTYSIVLPVFNTTQVCTDDFIFSSDGSKCIGKVRKK